MTESGKELALELLKEMGITREYIEQVVQKQVEHQVRNYLYSNSFQQLVVQQLEMMLFQNKAGYNSLADLTGQVIGELMRQTFEESFEFSIVKKSEE